MNELSAKILGAMESSRLGKMSVYVLSKQSEDLGLDLENLGQKDVPRLADKLSLVLPFFLGVETKELVTNIRKLGDNGIAVM